MFQSVASRSFRHVRRSWCERVRIIHVVIQCVDAPKLLDIWSDLAQKYVEVLPFHLFAVVVKVERDVSHSRVAFSHTAIQQPGLHRC
jgi:hypothetical protein